MGTHMISDALRQKFGAVLTEQPIEMRLPDGRVLQVTPQWTLHTTLFAEPQTVCEVPPDTWVPDPATGGHVRYVRALGGLYELHTEPPRHTLTKPQGAIWWFDKASTRDEAPHVSEGGQIDLRWDEDEAQDMCDQTFKCFLDEHNPDAKCCVCHAPKPPRWNEGAHLHGGHVQCLACEEALARRQAHWDSLLDHEKDAARQRAIAAIRRLKAGE